MMTRPYPRRADRTLTVVGATFIASGLTLLICALLLGWWRLW